MKFSKISLILSAFALFIFACSQTNPADTKPSNNPTVASNNATQPAAKTDELASSKRIFTEKCVKCHKEDGTGGASTIDGAKIKAPNFTSERLKNKDDAEYVENIKNGETEDGMPAFKGELNDEQIKNLVKFIRRDFQGK